MLVREILPQEKDKFDAVASHPMQTWAWGEFRKKTGVEVVRFGLFNGQNIVKNYQITIHNTPKLNWKVGYFPKADEPDDAQIFALNTAAEKYNLVFIKNEPNIYAPVGSNDPKLEKIRNFLTQNQHLPGKPMFTPNSFVLDISPSEDELFANLKQKTRYNIKVAQKNGVTVTVDDSDAAFETYIDLWKKTTKRQAFYSHDEKYHRDMWQQMRDADIAHLIKAVYQDQVLGVWIVFVHNFTLYYPYGASSRQHRNVMANNLLAWDTIRFGKQLNCNKFDMWGSLGANPDKNDPWYGFHRFKEGYGGTLMEFVGTYDFIHDPQKYQVLMMLDKWRWRYLRLRSKLPF